MLKEAKCQLKKCKLRHKIDACRAEWIIWKGSRGQSDNKVSHLSMTEKLNQQITEALGECAPVKFQFDQEPDDYAEPPR